VAILNTSPIKKKDPGCPTIEGSIGNQYFNNALCDLETSVSVMPKVVFDKFKHPTLVPTSMCLQLADQSVLYLSGITENVPVKIREFFVPVDFVVLDMHPDSRVSLIFGRPFLSTANTKLMSVQERSHSRSMEKREVYLPTPTRTQHQREHDRSRANITRRIIISKDGRCT
jgi:hypothetical protein